MTAKSDSFAHSLPQRIFFETQTVDLEQNSGHDTTAKKIRIRDTLSQRSSLSWDHSLYDRDSNPSIDVWYDSTELLTRVEETPCFSCEQHKSVTEQFSRPWLFSGDCKWKSEMLSRSKDLPWITESAVTAILSNLAAKKESQKEIQEQTQVKCINCSWELELNKSRGINWIRHPNNRDSGHRPDNLLFSPSCLASKERLNRFWYQDIQVTVRVQVCL